MRVCIVFLLFVARALSAGECSVTLDEALDSALCYNYTLETKRFMKCEGDARVQQAWSRFWPKIVWSGEYLHSPAASFSGTTIDSHSHTFEGRQIFFDSDAMYSLKIRRSELDSLRYEIEAFVDKLVFDVRSAYYLIVVSGANVRVQEENVRLLKEQASREMDRLRAGSSTQFIVDQATVAAANATTELHIARRNHKINQSSLAGLMGLDASQARCLEPVIKVIPLEQHELIANKIAFLDNDGDSDFLWDSEEREWWLETMYKGRSDLKAHKAQIASAEMGVHQQRSEYLPRVDGFARHLELSKDSFGASFFGGKTSYWETGVTFTWTLFDGFAREGRIREARMVRNGKVADCRQAVQAATLGLQDRFDDIEESLQAYQSARFAANIAESGVDRALKRHQHGAITPLEYRDSIYQLTDARQRELRAGYALLISYFALRRDTGLDRLEEEI
ncbi:hypothetical protein SCG7086_AC_00200 [Chlamydiales bacterium SCGC AG-110-P3]|nr:hypothetical protein SCG7086_AC_00200 [Chlamydiales bacterium SCGC AG-110-P3]